MNKGITEYDKYKLIRPLFSDFEMDNYSIPKMKKIEMKITNLEQAEPIIINSLTNKKDNHLKIVLPFNYDKDLDRYWNDPLKYVPILQTVMAVGTPDFSLYSNMNIKEIRYNVYRNRWLGCTWQSFGINALPTIGWGKRDTFDICFSGVEKGSIVMISTLGCKSNVNVFLEGYNEMIRRIDPPLVIVYGDMIKGMEGTFINYKYKECFNKKPNIKRYDQLKLFDVSPIFRIEGGRDCGI